MGYISQEEYNKHCFSISRKRFIVKVDIYR